MQLPTQVPGLNYTVPTLEKLEKLEDTISKLLYYSGFCWGVPKMMGFEKVTILKIWLFSVSMLNFRGVLPKTKNVGIFGVIG